MFEIGYGFVLGIDGWPERPEIDHNRVADAVANELADLGLDKRNDLRDYLRALESGHDLPSPAGELLAGKLEEIAYKILAKNIPYYAWGIVTIGLADNAKGGA